MNVQYTHDDAFRSISPIAIAGGSHRRWCTRTECMTFGVCKRCSGIDSHSEGVVDVLGVIVERGERAAHARRCFRSAGAQAALVEGSGREQSP